MSSQYLKSSCRYCGKPLDRPFLELGPVALANSYVPMDQAYREEFRCPLSLTWCRGCGLVQLTHVVPPELMFKNYLYVSSTTKTFQDHFAEYAGSVKSRISKKRPVPLAVDIGSNDGLLLKCYQEKGIMAVGVDPAENLAPMANGKGWLTINRYFDAESVNEIKEKYSAGQHADAISANNVFAHIDDIHSVLRNVDALLDGEGIFSIEFPYLVTMLDELLFDMIYHEHLSYIAVGPLQHVLRRFGFEIFDIERVSSHGGSLRVFAQKKTGVRPVAPIVGELLEQERRRGLQDPHTYESFARQVMEAKARFLQKIGGALRDGKAVSGYGAPAKASTLINYYGLTDREIQYVVDDNPLKQGHLVPGARIPIVPSSRLLENPTPVVIIFAWNFAKEILQKIGHLREKGVEFVLPVGKSS